jgi:DNA polymerase-3 subunit alpha
VVIAPEPIVEFAPLYRGTNDEITTQFAMSDIESIGLLKMDFLGLKTLTLIDDAVSSVERETGIAPDMDTLTLDDPQVYELFSRARTSGVFQFESEGMRSILRRLRPERFEDLIALNALYRPGPIGGGLIDDFIKRRHGKVKVEYPHPMLEDILRETYGVIVYQEQVMQIASRMAGYSLGEADILRRAMGKKKKEVMEAEGKKFVERAVTQGVKSEDARAVFDLMAFFAGYGFNKSHSAAYALVAYRTAWLKAHYPVHFMAALLTTEKGNTDKLVQYVNECREMGIRVLPPDVNRPGLDFTVEDGSIHFGLSAIKNVGEGAIQSLLDARERVGEFRNVFDLCGESDLRLMNKRVLEALNGSGAMDSLGARRSQIAAVLDQAMEFGQKKRTDRESGQGNLFGGGESRASSESSIPLPDLPEWDERTRLAAEKGTLGFYVTGHPLEAHRAMLTEFATHSSESVRNAAPGAEVALGGIVTDLRKRKAKKSGAWWAAFQLEDLDGLVEVLVFPKTFDLYQSLLENDRTVLVLGRAEVDEGRVRITADEIVPLEMLRERRAESVQLRLDAEDLEEETMGRLRRVLERNRGDLAVFLEVVRSGEYQMLARAETSLRVAASDSLAESVKEILGPGRLRYRAKRRASHQS